MMMVMVIKLILFVLLSVQVCFAQEWDQGTTSEIYYNDEFKKTYWHLGLGGAYGGSYYMNFENEDKYPKYIINLRLSQEVAPKRVGIMVKFSYWNETYDFPEFTTKYAERTKQQWLGFFGFYYKLPSGIPIINSYKPYFLLGGGYTDIQIKQMYMNEDRRLFNTELEGSGYAGGCNIGCEIELMRNLFSIDTGINFMLGKIHEDRVEIRNGDSLDIEEDEDPTEEMELNYYIGFVVNLF